MHGALGAAMIEEKKSSSQALILDCVWIKLQITLAIFQSDDTLKGCQLLQR